MEINSPMRWIVRPPETEVDLPKLMSFSTLSEIEICPRRWWLSSTSYPEIWDKHGYPMNPSIPLLIGNILHQSIETIIKALVKSNTASTDDKTFLETMRLLGGYPVILKNEQNKILKKLETNPRVNHKLTEIENRIKQQTPMLREQLQIMVSNLSLNNMAASSLRSNKPTKSGRHRLQNGFYAEIDLVAEELGWYGIVDYLRLTNEGCEIIDFKTGVKKPEHELQLHIYNLLWAYDKVRNPDSIPVSRLIVAYRDEESEITPLSFSELDDFAKQIKQRTDAALDEISKEDPEAKPSIENCNFCTVRQLCSTYWNNETQRVLNQERLHQNFTQKQNYFDIEIELEEPIADHIWNARIVTSGLIEPQTQVLVRFSRTNLEFPMKLKQSQRVRLLNVHLLEQVDEEMASIYITTNWQSEIFMIEAII